MSKHLEAERERLRESLRLELARMSFSFGAQNADEVIILIERLIDNALDRKELEMARRESGIP